MKKNQLVGVKGLNIKELKNKAESLRDDIANLTMDKNTNKLKDKKAIFKKRKDLAQVLTVLRQKEMLGQLESGANLSTMPGTGSLDSSEELKSQKAKVKKTSKNSKVKERKEKNSSP